MTAVINWTRKFLILKYLMWSVLIKFEFSQFNVKVLLTNSKWWSMPWYNIEHWICELLRFRNAAVSFMHYSSKWWSMPWNNIEHWICEHLRLRNATVNFMHYSSDIDKFMIISMIQALCPTDSLIAYDFWTTWGNIIPPFCSSTWCLYWDFIIWLRC